MTGACVALQRGSGEVTFAGAGHPPMLIVRGGGDVETLDSNSPPLGIRSDCSQSETVAQLREDDALLLYTDGLYGTTNSAGERLTHVELADLARPSKHSAEGFLNQLLADIAVRSDGNAFSDDIAAIAAVRTPGAAA